MPKRLLLGGIALGPTFAVVFLPLPVMGTFTELALASVGGLVALAASIQNRPARPRLTAPPLADTRSSTPLLHPAAQSQKIQSRTVPHPTTMRQALQTTLSGLNHLPPAVEPITRDGAIAQILNRFLHRWGAQDANTLAAQELTELYLIDQLLRGSPGEAGRIAQLFQHPNVLIDLRDELDKIAARRARYDRAHNAFLATSAFWDRIKNGQHPGTLLQALKSLQAPDIDLWHRVVVEHDPQDPEQRAAALWCLRQKTCDRATVAAFFGRVAYENLLQQAARLDDQGFLDAVRDLIDQWNDGTYRTSEIALPKDDVAQADPVLRAALDALAQMTQSARWPEPHGIFAAYPGRPPRTRKQWNLSRAMLAAPPRLSDYVDLPHPQPHLV